MNENMGWLCIYLASYKILRTFPVYSIRSLDIILIEIRKLVWGAMHVFVLYLIRHYCSHCFVRFIKFLRLYSVRLKTIRINSVRFIRFYKTTLKKSSVVKFCISFTT